MASRDNHILDAIFSGDFSNLGPTAPTSTFGEEAEARKYPVPNEHLLSQLKGLETDAVEAVEGANDLEKALQILANAMLLCPTYGSAYNNRAQVLRMQGNNEEALKDLDLAIEYGAGDAALLKQAYTQRAIVKKALGDIEGSDRDFGMGSKYGSSVAKQAVMNNPYAKMCNAIVTEVMSKYQPEQK
ncbi:hypothetical protein BC830DRAFT_1099305 [Chytriomyces sp. MP71]|nr:hypothetical protein BC830DRAFT_1099305 [Chytriomyces sp. MP71]